jgi:hypothetical protein
MKSSQTIPSSQVDVSSTNELNRGRADSFDQKLSLPEISSTKIEENLNEKETTNVNIIESKVSESVSKNDDNGDNSPPPISRNLSDRSPGQASVRELRAKYFTSVGESPVKDINDQHSYDDSSNY